MPKKDDAPKAVPEPEAPAAEAAPESTEPTSGPTTDDGGSADVLMTHVISGVGPAVVDEITREEQLAAVGAVLERFHVGHPDYVAQDHDQIAGAILDALDGLGIEEVVSSDEAADLDASGDDVSDLDAPDAHTGD